MRKKNHPPEESEKVQYACNALRCDLFKSHSQKTEFALQCQVVKM